MRGPLGRGWLAQVGESLSILLVARGSGTLRRLCADRMRASRDIDILGVYICGRRRTVRVCEWLCYVCEKDMSKG